MIVHTLLGGVSSFFFRAGRASGRNRTLGTELQGVICAIASETKRCAFFYTLSSFRCAAQAPANSALMFYFIIYIAFALLFCSLLLPPSRKSDPVSHSKLSYPLPTTVRAFHFYRDKGSARSALVDPRLMVPTHAIIDALDNFVIASNLDDSKFWSDVVVVGVPLILRYT